MKLVTGTYSFFNHDVSVFVFAWVASKLSAASLLFILILSLECCKLFFAESFGSAFTPIFASSGRPAYLAGTVTLSKSTLSMSSPASFIAFSLASRSSFSFFAAMANLRAFISSGVMGTLRLNPRLYLCVKKILLLSFLFQLRVNIVGISEVAKFSLNDSG